MEITTRVRPTIRAMKGYTPGEQPRDGRPIVKLNTNENPYPPPPVVLEAIAAAVSARLRLYPEPSARPVREAAARAYGVDADGVLVGNGSDDLLTIVMRTFLDPGQCAAAPDPTYSLYQTLAELQGASFVNVPWPADGSLPIEGLLATGANLIFVVRPNAPTGHVVPLAQVAELCERAPGLVVLDEAYADFATDNGLSLLPRHRNLMITRTFSKSFSLAGLRLGLAFVAPELAVELHKVRDSYNVDLLAQAAAVAALDHLDAFAPALRVIREARAQLTVGLRDRGFNVPDSEANFVLAAVPSGRRDGLAWLGDLKVAGFLVRYFGHHPALADKLRITIGTADEMQALLAAIDLLLGDN